MMKKLATATLLAAGLAAGAAHAADTYQIDPTHTAVTWEILHAGTSTLRGRFDKKEGTVELDRAAKTGKVKLTIDMASISSGTPAFDKHLAGKDFFDVAQFPTATFTADKFTFSGDKVATVAGTLTLKGITKPVTLKGTNFNCYNSPIFKREVCGGDFETVIERSQWEITYARPMAPDTVRLLVQVEAIKQ